MGLTESDLAKIYSRVTNGGQPNIPTKLERERYLTQIQNDTSETIDYNEGYRSLMAMTGIEILRWLADDMKVSLNDLLMLFYGHEAFDSTEFQWTIDRIKEEYGSEMITILSRKGLKNPQYPSDHHTGRKLGNAP